MCIGCLLNCLLILWILWLILFFMMINFLGMFVKLEVSNWWYIFFFFDWICSRLFFVFVLFLCNWIRWFCSFFCLLLIIVIWFFKYCKLFWILLYCIVDLDIFFKILLYIEIKFWILFLNWWIFWVLDLFI